MASSDWFNRRLKPCYQLPPRRVLNCRQREKRRMTDAPEQFPGRLLLYAINGWEVYPIKASAPLPPKFQWLDGLGDYFLFSKSVGTVTAIASRKPDGSLEGEVVGNKGGGARGRIGGKDFAELIGRVTTFPD